MFHYQALLLRWDKRLPAGRQTIYKKVSLAFHPYGKSKLSTGPAFQAKVKVGSVHPCRMAW